MLAYTGFGHTHKAGAYPEFAECLEKARKYLAGVQVKSRDPNSNGRFGSTRHEQWIYDHAIATAAMAELLVMSGDREALQQVVTDAVLLCLRAQNPGSGWKYGIQPGKSDTSVTAWMVIALKTAGNCRLDIPKERIESALKGRQRLVPARDFDFERGDRLRSHGR